MDESLHLTEETVKSALGASTNVATKDADCAGQPWLLVDNNVKVTVPNDTSPLLGKYCPPKAVLVGVKAPVPVELQTPVLVYPVTVPVNAMGAFSQTDVFEFTATTGAANTAIYNMSVSCGQLYVPASVVNTYVNVPTDISLKLIV